jgi:hypothetical protein
MNATLTQFVVRYNEKMYPVMNFVQEQTPAEGRRTAGVLLRERGTARGWAVLS